MEIKIRKWRLSDAKNLAAADVEQILFYRDEPMQELLVQSNYPVRLEDSVEVFDTCDFEDIDQDGNSDLTVKFALPDGS